MAEFNRLRETAHEDKVEAIFLKANKLAQTTFNDQLLGNSRLTLQHSLLAKSSTAAGYDQREAKQLEAFFYEALTHFWNALLDQSEDEIRLIKVTKDGEAQNLPRAMVELILEKSERLVLLYKRTALEQNRVSYQPPRLNYKASLEAIKVTVKSAVIPDIFSAPAATHEVPKNKQGPLRPDR